MSFSTYFNRKSFLLQIYGSLLVETTKLFTYCICLWYTGLLLRLVVASVSLQVLLVGAKLHQPQRKE